MLIESLHFITQTYKWTVTLEQHFTIFLEKTEVNLDTSIVSLGRHKQYG